MTNKSEIASQARDDELRISWEIASQARDDEITRLANEEIMHKSAIQVELCYVI